MKNYFKLPKKLLNKEPISQNGHRLYKGDVIRVLEHRCSCKICEPFEEGSLAIIAATQDEDPWLHATDCLGGEEPLLRFKTSKTSFGGTSCCFRACNVDLVYRETDEDNGWCISFKQLMDVKGG